VDVAALKSEFYTNTKKRTVFHCEIKSNNAKLNQLGSIPSLTNFIVNQSFVKKGMGVASKREVHIGPKII
jgi:hypothetical protein